MEATNKIAKWITIVTGPLTFIFMVLQVMGVIQLKKVDKIGDPSISFALTVLASILLWWFFFGSFYLCFYELKRKHGRGIIFGFGLLMIITTTGIYFVAEEILLQLSLGIHLSGGWVGVPLFLWILILFYVLYSAAEAID